MIWTDIIWYDIIYYIKNIFKKTKILIYLIVRILRVSQDLRIKIFFFLLIACLSFSLFQNMSYIYISCFISVVSSVCVIYTYISTFIIYIPHGKINVYPIIKIFIKWSSWFSI